MDTQDRGTHKERGHKARVEEIEDEQEFNQQKRETLPSDTQHVIEHVGESMGDNWRKPQEDQRREGKKAEERRKKWPVPVKEGKKLEQDARTPIIAERMSLTRHSSMEVKWNWFGEEDPLGVNEIM